MINTSNPPWGAAEEILRQQFRDKIIPICDEYSELLGEQANDLVQDEAGAARFGIMLANALAAALDVEINLDDVALFQRGDFNA